MKVPGSRKVSINSLFNIILLHTIKTHKIQNNNYYDKQTQNEQNILDMTELTIYLVCYMNAHIAVVLQPITLIQVFCSLNRVLYRYQGTLFINVLSYQVVKKT